MRYGVIMNLLSMGMSWEPATAKEGRPNMVWIFTDDHSCQTIGAYGGRLRSLNPSPNIDAIARRALRPRAASAPVA